MTSLKESLAVKYGLLLSPTPEQIARWKQRTQAFVDKGLDRENAADIAAQAIFAGYASGPVALSVIPVDEMLRSAQGG